jgi:hypothetical protein
MANPPRTFPDDLAAPGFLKSAAAPIALSSQQRAVLVRKGNELFNRGEIEAARRVFLTTGYTDGLVRVGDHYLQRSQPLEAFRMYWLAPEGSKSDRMIEKMAAVLRAWLKESDDVGEGEG